jgi:tartrate-resistant acid phosphatase type 5
MTMRSRCRVTALLTVVLAAGACHDAGPRAAPVPQTPTTAAPDPTATTLPPTTGATARVGADQPIAGFVAFGDFGGGPGQLPVAQAMLKWAAAHRVDALVTTGDNVYDFGEPALFPAQLEVPYRALRAQGRPLWATLGNHDESAGHGDEQLAFLRLPALPYVQQLQGVRLLFLDANRPDAAQAAWLNQQLDQPGPQFSVVVFHQPAFSCGLHGSTPEVDVNWVPVFEARRVALVLNGHDHDYFRFLSATGVTYVVTGGGGRGLYPVQAGCAPPELKASAVRYHFTAVEVYAGRLVVSAVGDDGAVFDKFEIPAPRSP